MGTMEAESGANYKAGRFFEAYRAMKPSDHALRSLFVYRDTQKLVAFIDRPEMVAVAPEAQRRVRGRAILIGAVPHIASQP